MRISGLIADDEAVSPVIGIILMVAITVILATVIGTFVLGVGQSAPEEQPQVGWRFDLAPTDDDFDSGPVGDEVTITHVSGDTIEENTGVQVGNALVEDSPDLRYLSGGFSLPIQSGQSVTVAEDGTDSMQSGDFVLVIYRPDKPALRTIVGEKELP